MAFQARLAQERKDWRKDKPFGFVAKPRSAKDGTTDLSKWDCIIPGKEGTPWEGGYYPVTLHFPPNYPASPPVAMFPPGFLHVNVYPSGQVCLSILNGDPEMGGQWAPSINVKVILLGIQDLLQTPNINSAAQEPAYLLFRRTPALYDRQVRAQALKYPQKDHD